jgi:hypothetical protein
MITQLLHLIDSAIRRAHPQSQSRSPFAWQSEFLFIQEKSKPAFSGIRTLANPARFTLQTVIRRETDPPDHNPRNQQHRKTNQ